MILNLTRCPPHRVFVLWVLKVCTLIFCTNGIGPPVLTIWLYILSIYDYMTLHTEYIWLYDPIYWVYMTIWLCILSICLYDSIYWVYDQMNSICDQMNSICPPLYTDFWDFVFVLCQAVHGYLQETGHHHEAPAHAGSEHHSVPARHPPSMYVDRLIDRYVDVYLYEFVIFTCTCTYIHTNIHTYV